LGRFSRLIRHDVVMRKIVFFGGEKI